MSSPTARTLKLFRDAGADCAIVEKWNMHAKIRQDLFGFIDILAIQGKSLIGIQATSGTNHSARLQKSMGVSLLSRWLATGARFQVWSWSQRVKRNKDGTKAKRPQWTPRCEEVFIEDRHLLSLVSRSVDFDGTLNAGEAE